jgi:hypothetical protein
MAIFVLKLHGQTPAIHDTRHVLSKDEVATLRRFLEPAGNRPGA